MNDASDRLVYSSDLGRLCPECSLPIKECLGHKKEKVPLGDGNVRVQRESKGRGGKVVTVVRGLPLEARELQTLLKSLKARCGSGGTVKEGRIEIQGDKRDLLVSELSKRGYAVKPSGG